MASRTLIRTALLVGADRWPSALRRHAGRCAGEPPAARRRSRSSAATAGSRFMPLGIGKSVVIDLPRDAKDVLVADPEDRQRGRALGPPRLHDRRHGRPDQHVLLRRRGPADRRLRHRGDARPQRRARRAPADFPHADIRVEGVGDGVVLTGSVASPAESQQAFDIAARLVGDGDKVVNGITSAAAIR